MSFKEEFSRISQSSKLVGSACVVVKEDRIIEEATFGLQSLATKKEVTKDTIFRIASISKIVVAMAVMSLIEDGKAHLDDDIGDILGYKIRNPHFPSDKITIRMLMTQTSSITDGYDDENEANRSQESGYNNVNGTNKIVSLKELLVENEGIYYTPLTWSQYKPGSKFIYSNFGCGILACIVEAITNELFTDYVERRILKPLNIDGSFRADRIKNKERIADLYRPNHGEQQYKVTKTASEFIDNCYHIFPLKDNFRGPAGGLFISMVDLSKIILVFINGGKYQDFQILKKSTIDMMLSLQWYGQGSDGYRAKGLQLRFIEFNGQLFKGHTGSAYGVISFLFFNVEAKLGICFITNGGYFITGNIEGFYSVEEDVFKIFYQNFFKNKESCFTFSLNNNQGKTDERNISFKIRPYILNDQIFMGLDDFLDALNILPILENDGIIINKGSKVIKIEKDVKIINVNDLVDKLDLKLSITDNQVQINF